MSFEILSLLLFTMLVVSMMTAVIRHDGDVFSWSSRPTTRWIFGFLGVFLIALMVIPELRGARELPAVPLPAQAEIPATSLDERFSRPEGDRALVWEKGRILANLVFLDAYGRVTDCDRATVDWDGEGAFVLRGEKELEHSRLSYSFQIDGVELKWNSDGCSLQVSGRQEVGMERKGGGSASSGGFASARNGEYFVFDGPRQSHAPAGLGLRRKTPVAGVDKMVLMLHPLDTPEASTRVVEAGRYLEPHLDELLHGDADGGFHVQLQVLNQMTRDSIPAFFRLIDQVGPGPFVLLAGCVLLALAAPRRRGVAMLCALFLNSFLLIAVDGYVTTRALDAALDPGRDAFQGAELVSRAGETFFHAGAVSSRLAEDFSRSEVEPEVFRAAWRFRVLNELSRHATLYRNDARQVGSGYCHDIVNGWYGLWRTGGGTNGAPDYLLVIPGPHGDASVISWCRAALAVEEIPEGIVVVRPGSLIAGIDAFVHVAPPERIPDAVRMATGDQGAFLKSDLWIRQIAPVFIDK